jgi:hypothetical protein
LGDDYGMPRPKPCSICRKWFRPDPRVGERQCVCSAPACQQERQRRNFAAWTQRHPEDAVRRRIAARRRRAAKHEAVDPLVVPAPLSKLPWDVAQKQFEVQGADFIAYLGKVLWVGVTKQWAGQVHDITRQSGKVPRDRVPKESAAQAP